MTCRTEMQSAPAEVDNCIATSSGRLFARKPGCNQLLENLALNGLVRLVRVMRPPGIIGHRLGGCNKSIGDRGKIGFAVVEAENQSPGSDPAQSQSFRTKVILQHPIVARGL